LIFYLSLAKKRETVDLSFSRLIVIGEKLKGKTR